MPMVEAEHDVSGQLELSLLEVALVDGVREVEARLTNRGAGLDFEWSAVWWDRAGAPLSVAPERWRRRNLAAGDSALIRFVAPAAAGESWRLLARTAGGTGASR
jgi:hypothetical protein